MRYKHTATDYKLLQQQYKNGLEIVKKDDFFKKYTEEKWRHSMQVAGAGNYIIKRIKWLQNKDEKFIRMVKSAVLLHDVCRFTEIVYMFKQKGKYDHGVGASELLRNMPQFCDIRIWLPIKHHGHIIEKLYEDEEYQQIEDDKLRDEVKKICFIIRDADKIANLNMMIREKNVLPLFLGKENFVPEVDGIVSEMVRQTAFSGTTTPRSEDSGVADRMIGYLSWFTDINYRYSIEYCQKLGVIQAMLRMLDEYCIDQAFKTRFKQYISDFINTHEYLE